MLMFPFLALIAPLLVYSQCYFPGGDLAASDVPCHPYAVTTLCCPEGWTCFSNNLCVVTNPSATSDNIGSSRRGTCTNPDWDNWNCGDFCLDNPVSNNSGDLIPCGDDRFCCAAEVPNGLCNCSTGDGVSSLDVGFAYTVIGVSGLDYTSTSEIPVSSTITPSSASSSLTTTITSAVTIHTTVVVSITSSGRASTTTRASATTSTATTSSLDNMKTGTSSLSDNTGSGISSTQSPSVLSQTFQSSSQSVTFASSSTSSSTTCSAAEVEGTAIPSSCEDDTTQAKRPVTHTTAFKASLGGGIPTASAILALLLFLFCRRRKKTRDAEQKPLEEPTQHSFSIIRNTVRQVSRKDSANHSPYRQGAPNPNQRVGTASNSTDLLRTQGKPDPYEPPPGMPLSDLSSDLSRNTNESSVRQSRSQFVPPPLQQQQRGHDPYEPPGGSPRRGPAVGMHFTQRHPTHDSFTIQRRPTPSQRYENPDAFHQTQTFPRDG